MRTKPLLGLLILGFAMVVLVPAITTGQQGGGGGGGKKGPKGGGGMDPNSLFEKYAKGQNFVAISNLRFGQDLAVQFAKDKGISNGQLTRDQFIEFQEQLNAKFMGNFGGGKMNPGGGKGNPGGKKGGPDVGTNPGNGGSIQVPNFTPNPDFINQLADADFKRHDANGDGKLNMDEMPDRLKTNLAKWDKNKDALIDLAEYREYFREAFLARMGGGGGGDNPNRNIAAIIIDEDEIDRKTIVFRAGPGGKMPAGLPAWFKELDTDGDGQVALYEWRRANKPLAEFKDWDLNDDGFITPEEAVKVQVALGKANPNGSSAVSADSGSRPSMASPDGKNRPPFDFSKMKGKKKGGDN